MRQTQIYQGDIELMPDFSDVKLAADPELINEYGIDACRMATVAAMGQGLTIELLESAYKWLSNFYGSFLTESNNFSTAIWLETALQTHDHIYRRSNTHAGLALIRKAFKHSKPGSNLCQNSRDLVLSCVYPFIPVIAGFLHDYPANLFRSIKSLLQCFPEFKPVRFAMQAGGWHWKVFDRTSYEHDPINCLQQIKWVKLATGHSRIKLCETDEGTKICFV